MARHIAQVYVGQNDNVPCKIAAADDNDLNKPVKWSSTDTVALCSDGDEIYGFINSIEIGSADGVTIVGVQINGRRKVTLDGAAAVGTVVEAAANAAQGTANSSNWGLVAVHTLVTTTAITLAASTFKKNWMVISGTGLDEADVLIEKQ